MTVKWGVLHVALLVRVMRTFGAGTQHLSRVRG